jgi:hypothetical protein
MRAIKSKSKIVTKLTGVAYRPPRPARWRDYLIY